MKGQKKHTKLAARISIFIALITVIGIAVIWGAANNGISGLVEESIIGSTPILHYVAGVSAGIVDDQPMLDLRYSEDSRAMVDLNCIMNDWGEIVELQGTGEGRAFTVAEQQDLVRLCAKGNKELIALQRKALGGKL